MKRLKRRFLIWLGILEYRDLSPLWEEVDRLSYRIKELKDYMGAIHADYDRRIGISERVMKMVALKDALVSVEKCDKNSASIS